MRYQVLNNQILCHFYSKPCIIIADTPKINIRKSSTSSWIPEDSDRASSSSVLVAATDIIANVQVVGTVSKYHVSSIEGDQPFRVAFDKSSAEEETSHARNQSQKLLTVKPPPYQPRHLACAMYTSGSCLATHESGDHRWAIPKVGGLELAEIAGSIPEVLGFYRGQ